MARPKKIANDNTTTTISPLTAQESTFNKTVKLFKKHPSAKHYNDMMYAARVYQNEFMRDFAGTSPAPAPAPAPAPVTSNE